MANWGKVNRNTWWWAKNRRVSIRIYKGDGFFGADLWVDYKETNEAFTSIDATTRKRDLEYEIEELIREWGDADMFEVFKKRYRAEYHRDWTETGEGSPSRSDILL